MGDQPLVKYDNKFWVLIKLTDSGMAKIWRDGKVAIIPQKEIKLM